MKITIGPFSGEVPRTAPTMLENHQAQSATNTRLEKGDVRGWKAPLLIASLAGTSYATLFKWEEDADHWIYSANELNWFKSPLAGDAYHRVYFTGETQPRMLASDKVSSPFSYATDYVYWGVPKPATAPTVESGGTLTRYYFYNFVNAYGEEGPPSDVAGGVTVGASPVTLATIDSTAATLANYNITKVYVYRTNSTTAGVGQYQFVLEAAFFSTAVAYAVGDFVVYSSAIYKCTSTHAAGAWDAGHFTAGDDVTDANLGDVCESENYDPPPSGMKGAIMLPNGIAVGYVGNTIYPSEPYFPHAFPTKYAQSIDEQIVALGYFGTTIVILTGGFIYIMDGYAPEQMTLSKIDFYPCSSANSVVMAKGSVFFSSPEGLIMVNANGAKNVSRAFVTPSEWADFYPAYMRSTFYNGMYFAFYSYSGDKGGIAIDFDNNLFFEFDFYACALFLDNDGLLYLVVDDDVTASPKTQCIKQWEGDSGNYLYYRWKSKKFQFPSYINLACARVTIDSAFYNAILELLADESYPSDLNDALFTASIATITGDKDAFTGTADDKIKVTIDSTAYDNINIGACVSIAEVVTAINTATGNTEASEDGDGYLTISGTYHVEIADGSTTAQTVVADLFSVAGDREDVAVSLGGGINEDSFNEVSVNATSITGESDLNFTTSIIFKLYADDELRFTKTISNDAIFRLPGGYRSKNCEIQVEGYMPVQLIEAATSIAEMLAS